jgi:hypothetical protein
MIILILWVQNVQYWKYNKITTQVVLVLLNHTIATGAVQTKLLINKSTLLK